MNEEALSRRSFIISSGSLLLGSLTAMPLITSCGKSSPNAPNDDNSNTGQTFEIDLDVSANQALKTPGGALKFNVPGQSLPVIVIRVSDTAVRALSSRCTHQGCEVQLPANNLISCSTTCGHGSRFNLSGGVVNGPATAPLSTISSRLDGNKIILTL
jgi:Rieske Fe-S protein